jgi:hypothetical protein
MNNIQQQPVTSSQAAFDNNAMVLDLETTPGRPPTGRMRHAASPASRKAISVRKSKSSITKRKIVRETHLRTPPQKTSVASSPESFNLSSLPKDSYLDQMVLEDDPNDDVVSCVENIITLATQKDNVGIIEHYVHEHGGQYWDEVFKNPRVQSAQMKFRTVANTSEKANPIRNQGQQGLLETVNRNNVIVDQKQSVGRMGECVVNWNDFNNTTLVQVENYARNNPFLNLMIIVCVLYLLGRFLTASHMKSPM